MNIKKPQIILLLLTVLQSAVSFTANAQVTKTANGILVKTAGKEVGLMATKNGAFYLSLNTAEAPSTINSIFIDASNKGGAPFTVISTAPVYGIKTAAGKLVINAKTSAWSLYDAAGHVVIKDGSYTLGDSTIKVKYAAAGLYYGSGNKSTKALEKKQGAAASGNGVVDIPYLWNTTGYSAFGVAVNDNKPADWKHEDKSVVWSFDGKSANLYLWPAKTMYAGANGYVKLTGRPKLPPRWAFGYLQSQWGWADSAYIADVEHKFRSHKLPVDAFIFDFEWYTVTPDYSVKKEGKEGFTDFGFNPKLFPHPAKQIAELKSEGIKFIGIRKPRMGNNLVLDTMRKNGWLKDPNTDSRDLNYSNAGARKWYEERNRPLINAGVDAWWDDEGESYYTCYYWWNTAQKDLLASARPNYRHFTLNRAFSPGNQRLGYCTWSGDIYSTWHDLGEVPMDLLNFSLAGMYYGACDIGGFHGTPAKEALVRWFEAGVFFPIMRSHSDLGTTARFPFLWGEDGESAIRKALDLRYQLLPYMYSLGHEAYSTGAPIMRPLVMEFPTDTAVANMRDEWLVGNGLLAAPVLTEGGKRKIYLPKDTWYNYFNGEVITGPKTLEVTKALDEIPVYVRAGTILPVGQVVQHSEQTTGTTLEIRVYPGKNSSFNLVEDDGVSYNYTKGNTRITAYTWNDKTKTLSWKVSGGYNGKNVYKTIKAVVGKKEKTATIGSNGSVTF